MAKCLSVPLQPFTVGDRVIHAGFTDCFGVVHPDSPPLVVERVQLIVCRSIPSYYRMQARGLDEHVWHIREGAASGFRPLTREKE